MSASDARCFHRSAVNAVGLALRLAPAVHGCSRVSSTERPLPPPVAAWWHRRDRVGAIRRHVRLFYTLVLTAPKG